MLKDTMRSLAKRAKRTAAAQELKKTAQASPLYWKVASSASKLVPDSAFRKVPTQLLIEPTNRCNLKCPVCPTTFAMSRDQGFMDADLYRSIIDEFVDRPEKPRIEFTFAGEPLLHKSVPDFIAYASERGHKTYISTNVTAVTKKVAKHLIEAGLSEIDLCVDGASKKSHETYRIGSTFEQVKGNIEGFMEVKKELAASNPYVSIQTLLTSLSENEIEQQNEWARAIGADSVRYKSLSMGSYTTPELLEEWGFLVPADSLLRRKQTTTYRTICKVPTFQAVVFWNGDLGLCCVDFDAMLKLPNIREKGFLNTLWSDEVVAIRREGFNKQHSMCKTCSMGNADYGGFEVELT